MEMREITNFYLQGSKQFTSAGRSSKTPTTNPRNRGRSKGVAIGLPDGGRGCPAGQAAAGWGSVRGRRRRRRQTALGGAVGGLGGEELLLDGLVPLRQRCRQIHGLELISLARFFNI